MQLPECQPASLGNEFHEAPAGTRGFEPPACGIKRGFRSLAFQRFAIAASGG